MPYLLLKKKKKGQASWFTCGPQNLPRSQAVFKELQTIPYHQLQAEAPAALCVWCGLCSGGCKSRRSIFFFLKPFKTNFWSSKIPLTMFKIKYALKQSSQLANMAFYHHFLLTQWHKHIPPPYTFRHNGPFSGHGNHNVLLPYIQFKIKPSLAFA